MSLAAPSSSKRKLYAASNSSARSSSSMSLIAPAGHPSSTSARHSQCGGVRGWRTEYKPATHLHRLRCRHPRPCRAAACVWAAPRAPVRPGPPSPCS
eukprot:scaffold1123_cov347-Prasinococcus_capsulatus_cf.AAC.1